MPTKMSSTGRTIFLYIGKDMPIVQIVGIQGVFSSRNFHKIGETKEYILFEYIPMIELGIRKIGFR